MKTLLILASLFTSSASFACSDVAIQAINGLARGLSAYSHPTLENAQAIISIAQTCPSSRVRERAVQVLNRAISIYSHPTIDVANAMKDICQGEENCTMTAINTLSQGISGLNDPTQTIINIIVDLVYQSPYPRVKSRALSVLSRCISHYDEPTRTCRQAILTIANIACSQSQLPEIN